MTAMPPADATILGYVAALLSCLSFVPQAARTIRTRDTNGISAAMYVTFVAGTAMWLWYGAAIHSMPVMASSSVTLLLSSTILVMKLRLGRAHHSL